MVRAEPIEGHLYPLPCSRNVRLGLATLVGMRRCLAAIVAVLAVTACRGGRPAPTPTTASTAGVTTTAIPVPSITASAIPGLAPANIHDKLKALGFTTGPPSTGNASFVTITSKRTDATVTTYGRTPTDVAKVVAEADKAAADAVLRTVAAAPLKGAEVTQAQTWVRTEVKKGPTDPTRPRSSNATYGGQPYDLVVSVSTATLSIGRIAA